MLSVKYLSAIMVLVGAVFLILAFPRARKIRADMSGELHRKWCLIQYLMGSFLLGYLLFDVMLIKEIPFPVELMSGSVFLGGAIFVFMVINISQITIAARQSAEANLKSLNDSLEQHVFDRTHDLRLSNAFNRTVLNSVQDPIAIIEAGTFRIIDVNNIFLQEFGLTKEQALGQACYKVTHHRSTPCVSTDDTCPLTETLIRGDHATAEHRHYDQHGKRKFVEIITSPIRDDAGKIIQVVHVQRDITDRKQAEERARSFDNLTGLPNRSFNRELLTRALSQAKRQSKTMAILFIDLDEFKHINDSFGHDIGDTLLLSFADRLLTCMRVSDSVARAEDDIAPSVVSRPGGDEFIVLLNEISQEHDAALVAQRILKALEQPFTLSGQEIFVTASIGISLFPSDGANAEEMINNAEVAMYYSKKHGRNSYHYFSASMNESVLERLTLENDLRRALERDELVLHYQPKYDARSKVITGMEALVRWQHPQKGMIPPLVFIPLAEATGLILPLGEWVLKTACEQNRAWQKAGLKSLTVAVNLSQNQLKKGNLVNVVSAILQETGLAPQWLELEITESAIMHNPEQAIATLLELQAMGVSVSIDDFGTGYSSLDHLRRIPLNSLKIDRSFIKAITENPDEAIITRAIISLAHSLKLKVVAEGVETEEQLAFLQALDCEEIQGYLFSRPVVADDFSLLITG